MNRITALALALVLAFTVLSAALAEPVIIPVQYVPEEGLQFTKADALAKAEALFAESGHTYDAENYTRKAGSVRLPDGQSAWIVFIERRNDKPDGNLYAVLSADDGSVIELYYPDNDVYTWLMMQWISAKDRHMSDWSIEEQALFDWLFSDSEDKLFEPSETGISSEEAVLIAAKWLKEHFNAAYDETHVSYLGLYDDRQDPWYCWVVSFLENGKLMYVLHVNTETGEVVNSFDAAEGVG